MGKHVVIAASSADRSVGDRRIGRSRQRVGGAGQGAAAQHTGPRVLSFQARQHRGDGRVGRAAVDRRSEEYLPRPDRRRDRQDDERSFPADQQCGARPERPGDQHRRQARAVRDRHELGETHRCDGPAGWPTSKSPASIPTTSTRSFPPTRISTMSAGSWPRTAAATSPTRRSISPSPTSNSGPTTSGWARRAEGSGLTAKQKPAAQSRPPRVLQGRPGRHARRAGDAHAGTYGRAHQLRDHIGRQVAVPGRRPHAPRHR